MAIEGIIDISGEYNYTFQMTNTLFVMLVIFKLYATYTK